MKKILIILSLSLFWCLPAHAQSSATPIVIGTNSVVNGFAKFIPATSSAPIPAAVFGGTATQVLTSNGPGVAATFQPSTGGGGSGTVNIGSTGQIAAYLSNGTAVSPTNNIDLNNGGVTIGTTAVGNTPPLNGAYIQGSLAVGSPSAASKLTISGNVSIGTDYSISAAPTNGAIIEGNVGIGTTVPDNILSLGGQSAQTINIVRNTTASTAGQNLTIRAGGATPLGTNQVGGSLILSGGIGTGTSLSPVTLQVQGDVANGTGDTIAQTIMTEVRNNTASTAQARVDIVFSPKTDTTTSNFTLSTDANQNNRFLGKIGAQGAYFAGGNDANAYFGAASTGTLFFGAAGNTNTNFMQMTSNGLAVGTTVAPTNGLGVAGSITTNSITLPPTIPVVTTTTTTATSNVTLANITGLSANLIAGKTYTFEMHLFTTATVTGGVQFDLGGGTATATSLEAEGFLNSGSTITASTRTTTLTGVICSSATPATGTCTINGSIVVNAAGTFVPRFAQNTTNAGASTVLTGSYMILTQTNQGKENGFSLYSGIYC